MEVKSIPINPDEKGIIVMSGVTRAEFEIILENIKEWMRSNNKICVIGLQEGTLEFIKVGEIVDFTLKDEPKGKSNETPS